MFGLDWLISALSFSTFNVIKGDARAQNRLSKNPYWNEPARLIQPH